VGTYAFDIYSCKYALRRNRCICFNDDNYP
jgi:hypothetical protein